MEKLNLEFHLWWARQVLTAIYPAPTIPLATGVVSVTTVPPAAAAPAQDVVDPPSPSAVATPQPGVEVEQKIEVKKEKDAEEDGQSRSSCVSHPAAACTGLVLVSSSHGFRTSP